MSSMKLSFLPKSGGEIKIKLKFFNILYLYGYKRDKQLLLMSKVQTIIKEIESLNTNDLEYILSKVKNKLERKKKIEAILDSFIGRGKGIWKGDAQEYISEMREKDRQF